VHFVDDLSHKNRLLDHLLRDTSMDQAVVFTATKRDADTIADRLNIAGFAAAALHGDMHRAPATAPEQPAPRPGAMLVATDVAARGIDVPTITHVFNYDLPKFAEDYVHRIGRTGRAGRNGVAISLVNHAEGMQVKRIERFTKQTIPVDVVEGSSRRSRLRTAAARGCGRRPVMAAATTARVTAPATAKAVSVAIVKAASAAIVKVASVAIVKVASVATAKAAASAAPSRPATARVAKVAAVVATRAMAAASAPTARAAPTAIADRCKLS
jgi:superfamily II DNA/RNA helicase